MSRRRPWTRQALESTGLRVVGHIHEILLQIAFPCWKWRFVSGVVVRWFAMLHGLPHVQLIKWEAHIIVHELERRHVLQTLLSVRDFQLLLHDRQHARSQQYAFSRLVLRLLILNLACKV